MNFKKRVNGSWVDTSHYIYNTSTDTLTTLPADVYADGNSATVGLVGNMSQTGTPTPSSPIQPSECGERTGNLWDESYTNISTTLTYKSFYVGDGIFTASTDCPISYPSGSSSLFFIAGNVSTGASSGNNLYNNRARTVESINGYVTIAYRITGSVNPNDYNTMINSGSTALPYEPYGYKIPILSASTTTPVYLGEVETTRNIKKLVLTGEEDWRLWSSDQPDVERYYYKWGKTTPSDYGLICTHLPFNSIDGNYEHVRLGGSNHEDFITFISKTIAPTVADFKAYLAAQYANGTPVTVWYVLATPQTAVVNEPIRKIGDYADTVSGIAIPTIAGANSFDVLTTLKPSEVTVNYKGWHPIQNVHEAENGQWD